MIPEPVMVHVVEPIEPMPIHVAEPIEIPVHVSEVRVAPEEEPITVHPAIAVNPALYQVQSTDTARGQEMDPFAIALAVILVIAVVIGVFWGNKALRSNDPW